MVEYKLEGMVFSLLLNYLDDGSHINFNFGVSPLYSSCCFDYDRVHMHVSILKWLTRDMHVRTHTHTHTCMYPPSSHQHTHTHNNRDQ